MKAYRGLAIGILPLAALGGLSVAVSSDAALSSKLKSKIRQLAGAVMRVEPQQPKGQASREICGRKIDPQSARLNLADQADQPPRKAAERETAQPLRALAVGTVIRTPLETCLANTLNAEMANVYDEAEKVRSDATAAFGSNADISARQLRKVEASMALSNDTMRNGYVNLPNRNMTPDEMDYMFVSIAGFRFPDQGGKWFKGFCKGAKRPSAFSGCVEILLDEQLSSHAKLSSFQTSSAIRP